MVFTYRWPRIFVPDEEMIGMMKDFPIGQMVYGFHLQVAPDFCENKQDIRCFMTILT